jgi:hypothetical protein
MPLYDFENKETGERFDLLLSLSKREKFLELNPHVKQIILTAPTLVSGTNHLAKLDDGWKENMSRIAEAHPGSAFAEKHGGRSATAAKVQDLAKKHGLRKKGQYNMDL